MEFSNDSLQMGVLSSSSEEQIKGGDFISVRKGLWLLQTTIFSKGCISFKLTKKKKVHSVLHCLKSAVQVLLGFLWRETTYLNSGQVTLRAFKLQNEDDSSVLFPAAVRCRSALFPLLFAIKWSSPRRPTPTPPTAVRSSHLSGKKQKKRKIICFFKGILRASAPSTCSGLFTKRKAKLNGPSKPEGNLVEIPSLPTPSPWWEGTGSGPPGKGAVGTGSPRLPKRWGSHEAKPGEKTAPWANAVCKQGGSLACGIAARCDARAPCQRDAADLAASGEVLFCNGFGAARPCSLPSSSSAQGVRCYGGCLHSSPLRYELRDGAGSAGLWFHLPTLGEKQKFRYFSKDPAQSDIFLELRSHPQGNVARSPFSSPSSWLCQTTTGRGEPPYPRDAQPSNARN